MKSVKQIEEAIKELSREEFMSLANKIAAHQAALWEEQEKTDNTNSLEFLSEGEEEALKIRAETDKQKAIILAEAYKQAQEISGEGDAQAVEIYANAFKSDPNFYEFTRTLETYQKVIDSNTTLILSTDSELLNLLKGKK